MSATVSERTASAVRPAKAAWRLPATGAFYLQASITMLFLAASSAPTPLYATYQAEWGFSPITITIVFGVYALAVLAALLTVGKLSDHIGRRPVLLAALALQAAAMLVFVTADGVTALLVARVIQGLSTGAAVGAVGAGLLDLNRAKGTTANAVAPIMGTATGGIAAGVLVQFLPAPAHLVYLVLLGFVVLQFAGVLLMAETSSPIGGALASLRPRFALPVAARRAFLLAAPVLIAMWALAGFYGSLGPSLVRSITGSHSPVLGGLSLFTLAGAGAIVTLLVSKVVPSRAMLAGTVALIAGVAITLLAVSSESGAWFFAGTAIAGAGFGGGFQGAIRTVIPLAAPHERSGLLSTLYVVSYLAMGLPAVIAGVLVVHTGSVLVTAHAYGIGVIALAAAALAGQVRLPRRARGAHRVHSGAPVAIEVPAEPELATSGADR